MNNRQIEELAKAFFDLGKLTYGSLVLGFFQTKTDPFSVLIVTVWGLTLATLFFMIGLKLLNQTK